MENLLNQKPVYKQLLHEKNVVNSMFLMKLTIKKKRRVMSQIRKTPKLHINTLLVDFNYMTIGEFSILYFLNTDSKQKFKDFTLKQVSENKLGIVKYLLTNKD